MKHSWMGVLVAAVLSCASSTAWSHGALQCAVYPIALPQDRIAGAIPGQAFEGMPRGNGTGQFSWLSWNGEPTAPTLAASLVAPGNAGTYVNPGEVGDHELDVGDFVQGAPGSMNAAAVRDHLDLLIGHDIVVPVWDAARGQGNRYDYRVASFATIRLRAYSLTGNGTLSFEYRGATSCHNRPPLALEQTLTMPQDATLEIALAGNDPDGDALTFRIVAPPARGTLSGTAPSLHYASAPGFVGEDIFTFAASDGVAESEPATIRITVQRVEYAPVAQPQTLTLAEDAALELALSASDPNGDELTYRVATQPQHGTLSGIEPTLVYTPTADFRGTDQFQFAASDASATSTATITLIVTPVNDAPVALGQALQADEDEPLALVLGGEDADGDALTYTITQAPRHGTLSGTAPELSFRPHRGYSGSDAIVFVVNDGTTDSAPATVSLAVRAINDAPFAENTTVSVEEDGTVTGILPATDEESDPLTYTVDVAPEHGTLAGTPPGYTYTPAPDYFGRDEFRWRANDGRLDSHVAIVSIDVLPVDDAPRATDLAVTTEEGRAVSITLMGTDVDSSALAYSIEISPAHGTLSGSEAERVYTPNAGYSGEDRFTYVVSDGSTSSVAATVRVTIAGTNRAPVITTPPVTTVGERQPYAYDVEATDPDADVLTFSLEQGPASMEIDAANGRLEWGTSARRTQPMTAEHRLCYSNPAGAIERDELNARVRDAIALGGGYVAREAVAWNRRNPCLGCHVQTQGALGLQAASPKVDVDAAAAQELLDSLLTSQKSDGSIWRFDPQQPAIQTTLALWSMSYVPSPDVTFDARRRALDFLWPHRVPAAGTVSWRAGAFTTHTWLGLNDQDPMTAIVALGASRYLRDADGREPTPEQTRTRSTYLAAVPMLAEYFLARAPLEESETLLSAFRLIGLGEIRPLVADASLAERIDAAVARLERVLIERQRFDGGWARTRTGDRSDPISSAWVGFALEYRHSGEEDEAVRRNVEYLLATQALDGTWPHDAGFFVTSFGPASTVIAYLPLALDQFDPLADLTVGALGLDAGDLTAVVYNRGLAAAPAGSSVRFVRDADGAELGSVTVPELAPGAQIRVAVPAADVGTGSTVRATVRSSATECATTNNEASAQVVSVSATDPGGLADTQTYLLNVADENDAPTITTAALPDLHIGRTFETGIAISDADVGDAHEFSLVDGPPGVRIDRNTGRLLHDRELAVAGTHVVRVRVVDLRGASAEREFPLTIVANRPPVIVSEPPHLWAIENREYRYEIRALDPDGDPIMYSAPPHGNLRVDPTTGLLTWTPGSSQRGTNPISVRVSDGRGGVATQSFVVTTRLNKPAFFTTTPPTRPLRPDEQFRYDADGDDPDGDPVTFAHGQGDAGFVLDAATGVLTLTPWKLGEHFKTIYVRDVQGDGEAQLIRFKVVAGAKPAIVSTPPTVAKVGCEYRYDAVAADVNEDPLAFSVAGPAGMTVDATGHVRWTPGVGGTADATLRVSDRDGSSDQAWSVEVANAETPLTPVITISPTRPQPGELVTIRISATGAAGQVTTTAAIDGAPLALEDAVATATYSTAGTHTVSATVSDGCSTQSASATFEVGSPIATIAELSEPAHEARITKPTAVRGRVAGSPQARWELLFREAQNPQAVVTRLAQGTGPFETRDIATFDPTLLPNGQYTIALNVSDGIVDVFDSVTILVDGDMKIGHFSLTFEDVSIPVAGIPIRVTRTYDTRHRNEPLDFGQGWSVDYQNVRVQESHKIGHGWKLHELRDGIAPRFCMRSDGDRRVTVRMPDGDIEVFRATTSPSCQVGAPFEDVHLSFEPLDGTDSTLEQTSYGMLRLIETGTRSDLVEYADPDRPPADPTTYRLTTPEGLVYDLDQTFGIRKVTDPSGNTLTYSNAGILHRTQGDTDPSDDVGVRFLRDAKGRIEGVELPDGGLLSYTYDAAGDLVAFSDALVQTTRFSYANPRHPHYLAEILDPRGVRAIRNEYDDDGRLVRTIDADGKVIEYTHDIVGRTERVKDRRGFATLYEYDEEGRVLSETNALNETTRHTYDVEGNELTRTDPLGQVTTWTYDDRGNVLTETNHLGETTTSTFDPRNQLLTRHDARGTKVIENSYHSRNGGLVSTKDALGNEMRFEYDTGLGSTCQSGELVELIDASQGRTRYALDWPFCRGWRVSETDALGHRTSYVHDTMGRVKVETRTRTVDGRTESLVTAYTYDDKGRVTRTDLPDGSFTTTTYNALDKPERECDAEGRCTVTTYDARGQVSRVDHPDGTYEATTYDANGNVATQTDRAGRTTKLVYDAANRLVETIHPDSAAEDGNDANNPRTKSVYDAAGRLTSTVDERGHSTRYEYDDANRRTKVIEAAVDGLAAETETHYDAAGRRTAVVDALGRTTRFAYDDAGRLVETVHADSTPADDTDNPRTRLEYDAAGRKRAEVDELGRRTEYRYDALGRLTEVHLAAGSASVTVTKYRYDEAGNRTEQIDAENRTTRFGFDAAGREIARTLPLGQRESKAYHVAGELAAHSDFAGRTTQWTYDAAGRIETIDYPNDADVTFSYTPTGQRASAAVAGAPAPARYAYDRRDRLVTKTDAEGRTIEYRYDAAGNLVRRSTDHQMHSYEYDARNRLVRVVSMIGTEPARETRYEYDAVGNRRAMVGADGVRTEYAYDARNRLTNLVKRTAASVLLFAASYTVDAAGMRTAVEEADASGTERTLAFEYDDLERLTKESIVTRDAGSSRIATWTYDKVGNRLTQQVTVGLAATPTTTTYVYDANDRLVEETTDDVVTRYTYDANGNTTTRQSAGTLVEYAYDDANRLVDMRQGGVRFTYAYDADGLRIAQTEHPTAGAPATTHYLQDGSHAYSQVIESHREHGGTTQLEAVYNFADGLLSQTRYASGVASTRFVHQDGFGSTRFLTDGAATRTDAWSHDAFGNEIARSGSTPMEHLYRGERFDDNSGFYDLRARLYNAASGRFLTQDTFDGFGMEPPSLHKYTFNHNDSVNRVDPSGHFSLTEFNTVASIIGIGSMTIHAGFRMAEGDYRGAAREVARDAVFWALGAGVGRVVAPLSKAAFGLFSRTFIVPLELGAQRSGAVLTRNMEAVMARAGMAKPPGWQAHHIVGEAFPEGKAAMVILRKFRIDVNSPLNGVFLPGCGARGTTGLAGLAVHCGKHVQEYERHLLRELREAASETAAVNILGRIRQELMSGELFLNARGNL